ncbi:MAG: TerC family protein [Weeksellaceae bacterium]|jgi:tellurite resistance protein TerC|nr:TerC family protein [Weeksellaceae bacterium]MDX9704121.1 TerC family protein [Weeksellaceae bacterium]
MVWIVFLSIVAVLLALDLGVFNKNAHTITHKEAAKWTAFWVGLSLLFSGVLYWLFAHQHIDNPQNYTPETAFSKYLQGYLLELSLSVDNIFVIAVIFKSFSIPQKYQHRVLFWGIIGAVVFRAIMIFFGIWLINKVDWIIYVFGAFLIYTAVKMAFSKEEGEFNPRQSKVFKWIRKIMPITQQIQGQKLIVRRMGIWAATPLLLALIIIEFTDILFALDSIPAILAITEDPFIVFSSNIMAILGLRSMYFFLANVMDKFSYLKYSLSVILIFVGIKMLLHDYLKINEIDVPEWLSFGVILLSLAAGIIYSLYKNKANKNVK